MRSNLRYMDQLISVLLPAYNAEKYIAESIKSILGQTYTNFEFIIINDGSRDNTENIILSFDDSRIVYVKNEVNKGLINTLNRGLDLAKGEFIARMDADDISLYDRFAKQIEVFVENENIIVCGTDISYIGNETYRPPYRIYSDNDTLKRWLVRQSCFAHPTVMIRKSILDISNVVYDINFKDAEDYKMWIDLSSFGCFYNIPEKLLKYRISETQISQSTNHIQKNNAKICRRLYIHQLYPKLNISDILSLQDIQEIKQEKIDNKFLLDALYLSLNRYSSLEFYYYITKLDWLSFNFYTNLAILKRFIYGPNPLL